MIVELTPNEVRDACIQYAKAQLLTGVYTGKRIAVINTQLPAIKVGIYDQPKADKAAKK